MSPPNSLRMRNPLDPQTAAERVYNKLDDEKLKSPGILPSSSPLFEKHINHVLANQHVFDTINNRLLTSP
jgi:hypothetical protein